MPSAALCSFRPEATVLNLKILLLEVVVPKKCSSDHPQQGLATQTDELFHARIWGSVSTWREKLTPVWRCQRFSQSHIQHRVTLAKSLFPGSLLLELCKRLWPPVMRPFLPRPSENIPNSVATSFGWFQFQRLWRFLFRIYLLWCFETLSRRFQWTHNP